MVHYFGLAAARLVFGREDVQPLHHADVLMGEGVAMHDETPDRLGVEIDTEGDRADLHILVEVRPRVRQRQRPDGLRLSTGNKDGVVPLGYIELYAVDVGDQKRVLVDVERVVRKR